MGHRLHVATKYEVEYDSGAYFNWSSENINPIIECLSEGDFWSNDNDFLEAADTLEASREVLLRNLPNILTPNSEWENQEELNEKIEELERKCGIDRQYLYDCLKSLVESSDPNNDLVHFAWF